MLNRPKLDKVQQFSKLSILFPLSLTYDKTFVFFDFVAWIFFAVLDFFAAYFAVYFEVSFAVFDIVDKTC